MTQEYYARIDYLYEGGDAKFSIPFSYINKEHIVAIIDEDTENPITDLEFLTDNQVKINKEIMSGSTVSIRRITPLDNRFVIFTDGNILDEESQNLSALQVFDVVQEIKDANNWLLNQMQEFIALKQYIDKALVTLDDALNSAQEATEMNIETQQLLNDVSNSYENLKAEIDKGVKTKVTHNLFEIITTDKELTEQETIGLARQGSIVKQADYPTAYNTILNEYETGTKKVYTSSTSVIYVNSYTGNTLGTFYQPSSMNLAVGENIYSNTTCTTSIGSITAKDSLSIDKYTGNITTSFYVNTAITLEVGSTVYSDKALTQVIGTVEELKQLINYKYKGNKSGIFYTSNSVNLRVGRILYKDMMLSEPLGTITKMEEVSSDKYSVSGLEDIDYFYVPTGTIIQANTPIYKDAACTEVLSTITGKGTVTAQSSYCYSYKDYVNGNFAYIKGHYKYFPSPFYTKELIKSKTEVYKDSSCLTRLLDIKLSDMGKGLCVVNSSKINLWDIRNVKLVSSSTSASNDYITIGTDTTKLSYYKQATVKAEVIVIGDNGSNETYKLEGIETGNFIKISDIAYQAYNKISTETITTLTIAQNSTTITDTVTSNGVVTTAGIAFEYIEASNGHNIVSSVYQSQLTNIDKLFYVVDFENAKFKLPVLTENEGKYYYFCVGNTVIVQSGIQGVTKAELNDILESYVKNNDEVFQTLISIVSDYTDVLGSINTSLADILGE